MHSDLTIGVFVSDLLHANLAVHSVLRLEDMGFTKLVNEIDMKEAARLGLHSKPLTKRGIEKHLEDVGIEPEVGSHTRMRGLSGGQKVKVVLAAAMWLNPHMVSESPRNCQQFGGLPFPV